MCIRDRSGRGNSTMHYMPFSLYRESGKNVVQFNVMSTYYSRYEKHIIWDRKKKMASCKIIRTGFLLQNEKNQGETKTEILQAWGKTCTGTYKEGGNAVTPICTITACDDNLYQVRSIKVWSAHCIAFGDRLTRRTSEYQSLFPSVSQRQSSYS